MSPGPPRINVAILAVPEVTAFATYAMYDLFAGAGRTSLKLLKTRQFTSGNVLLYYRPITN